MRSGEKRGGREEEKEKWHGEQRTGQGGAKPILLNHSCFRKTMRNKAEETPLISPLFLPRLSPAQRPARKRT